MKSAIRAYLQGAGSILDLCPAPRPSRVSESLPKHESVEAALRRDWEMIGGDMERAMRAIEERLQFEHGRAACGSDDQPAREDAA